MLRVTRWLWPGVGWLALLALLCSQGVRPSCAALLAAQRYGDAAVCGERLYQARGDLSAARVAALAHYHLGHGGTALAWMNLLVGAPEERGLGKVAAALYQSRNRSDLAERALRRDLPLLRAAGDARSASEALYWLYYLCRQQSRTSDAFAFVSQAVEEARRAGDRDLEQRAAEGLFVILDEIGDLDGAKRALWAAHGLRRPGDPAASARFHLNWGSLLFEQHHVEWARRELKSALRSAAADPGQHADRTFFRALYIDLAHLHLDRGDLPRARYHLDRAFQYADQGAQPNPSLLCYRARLEIASGDLTAAHATLAQALGAAPPDAWRMELETLLGRVHEERGELHLAEAAYERAAALVEQMRAQLTVADLKTALLDGNREPFERLFLLQARSGRATAALATAERVQARTLLDSQIGAVTAPEAADPGPRADGEVAARLRALEALQPQLASPAIGPLQPLARVLQNFGSRHCLMYFRARDTLWLIVVAEGTVRLRRLTFSPRQAGLLVERLLAHPDDSAAAERLSAVLLPAPLLPPRGTPIYLVADGDLGNLPFAALRGGGRYLVEDHPLVVAPSLNGLALIEGLAPAGHQTTMVLADALGDLPGAGAEAREVAQRLGGTALLASRATSRALASASSAALLHLATHTGLGPRGPWLRLADREVSAAEIIARRIAPRLVVLATCTSAARQASQMWGSLAGAFLAAGSRSALASLGSIEDQAARSLVRDFYAAGGAANPAAALARAQRVAIRRGASPSQWALFTLIGSGRSPGGDASRRETLPPRALEH